LHENAENNRSCHPAQAHLQDELAIRGRSYKKFRNRSNFAN
jgi:hypothetical protein